jgi:hypothetical protein
MSLIAINDTVKRNRKYNIKANEDRNVITLLATISYFSNVFEWKIKELNPSPNLIFSVA